MKDSNEKYLKQLVELIRSLTELEIDLLKKHYLGSQSSSNSFSKTKMLNLVDLVESNYDINYSLALFKISPNASVGSFNKLIKRVISRILDVLISDIFEKQKETYSDIFRNRLSVGKQLMKCDMLIAKGLFNLAEQNLILIIRKSKEYEFFSYLLEALYRQLSYSNEINSSNIENHLKEIEFYENCRKKQFLARTYYNTYKKYIFSTTNFKSDKFSINDKLIKLLSYAKETKSANIYSYYYLLYMENCFRNGEIQKEINTGIEFIKLLKKSNAVFSTARLGYINSSLSNSAISVGQFELGNRFSSNAIYWTKISQRVNLVAAYLMKIKSLIYLGRYSEVKKVIKEVNKYEYLISNNYHTTQLGYLKAINSFALKEFKKTLDLLNNLKELEKDKEGWNIWVQVLRIQAYIELERFTEVEFLIENLRKYLIRIQKKYTISQRPLLISKLLVTLKGCNFDFKLTAKKKPDLLEKLTSLNEDYRWDGRTPEMILFHDWFDAKVNQAAYQPNFEPYRVDLEVDEQELEMIN